MGPLALRILQISVFGRRVHFTECDSSCISVVHNAAFAAVALWRLGRRGRASTTSITSSTTGCQLQRTVWVKPVRKWDSLENTCRYRLVSFFIPRQHAERKLFLQYWNCIEMIVHIVKLYTPCSPSLLLNATAVTKFKEEASQRGR